MNNMDESTIHGDEAGPPAQSRPSGETTAVKRLDAASVDDLSSPGFPASEIHDGFPGERMRVLPRPLVRQALTAPLTSSILVTDAGFFPQATRHGRRRRSAHENIIILCTIGRGICEIDGVEHEIRSGQVLVIPGGVPHHYRADSRDPWTIWWIHVVGSQVPPLMRALTQIAPGPVLDVGESTRIAVLMDRILHRLERDESSGSMIAAGGAAWHLMAVLISDATAPRHSRQDPIREVRQHMRENVAERFTVGELAAIAGYSTSHFSALFRRDTGFGPLEYQTRLRMSRARELLDTTDHSVAAIAMKVGYADSMYFSRQFKRIHDVSPSQYRARVARQPS